MAAHCKTHLSTQIGNNANITKSYIQKLHEDQVFNGHNNKHKALDIIDVFGGIDIMLGICMESDILSNSQLQQLHQILTHETPRKNEPNNQINNFLQLSAIKDQSGSELFGYTFDPSNAFMYSIFQENTATKLITIIYHKYTIMFLAFMYITTQIFSFTVSHYDAWMLFIYSIAVVTILFLPWTILVILSSNKVAFKKVSFSFDFVNKTAWTIMYGVATSIRQYINVSLDPHNHNHTDLWNISRNIECINSAIWIILIVMAVALFDAIPWMGLKSKMLVSILTAIYFTYLSIMWGFLITKESVYVFSIPTFGSEFYLHSFMSDCCRIIAIFAWKAAIVSYFRKGKCLSIRYTPFIQWKDPPKVTKISKTPTSHNTETFKPPVMIEVEIQDVKNMSHLQEKYESESSITTITSVKI
eukprot:516320_1